METEILYSDAQITVCLKSVGVDSEQSMTALLRQTPGGEHFCVHRLDKSVGGVIVFARTKQAAAALSAAVAARRLEKEYLAVVQGVPDEPQGQLRDLLYHDAARNKSYVVTRPRRGVKEALLDYALLESAAWEGERLSLLRIRLHTGRSHQIRVQLASRGMPLVGDGRYGSRFHSCPPALWSARLCFPHPQSGAEMCFSAVPAPVFPWALFSLHNA